MELEAERGSSWEAGSPGILGERLGEGSGQNRKSDLSSQYHLWETAGARNGA